MNALRVPMNALERPIIGYNSVTMSKNALGVFYKSCRTCSSWEFVAKVLKSSKFCHKFPIDLLIARADYSLYDAVKIFRN